ncbi:helix-turn-helix domain-containing protein [Actinoplanes auranticolor]|nr:helix-turn-helix transcriptional regulator [Actinoplanes auranticolor]
MFDDEFASYLDESLQDPEVRAAYEDGEERHRIVDSLIALRRALRLTQKAVAGRMGVRQPAVSEFENEANDPRLSTLQRYARAVEARLKVVVEMPAECDWISTSLMTYSPEKPTVVDAGVSVTKGNLARTWRARSDWELTA